MVFSHLEGEQAWHDPPSIISHHRVEGIMKCHRFWWRTWGGSYRASWNETHFWGDHFQATDVRYVFWWICSYLQLSLYIYIQITFQHALGHLLRCNKNSLSLSQNETQRFFAFVSQTLGKIPMFTSIFQLGWNHQQVGIWPHVFVNDVKPQT